MSEEREEEIQVEENSFLDMSDEDIANFDPTALMAEVSATKEAAEVKADDEPTGEEVKAGTEAADEGEPDKDEDEKPVVAELPAVEEKPVDDTPVAVEKPAEEKPATTEPVVEPKEKDEKPKESTDYKAEYEKVLAPFTANGKQIQVQSAEEAVSLMQMGANYNKKMSALKPNLKLLKLLENNGLLSEEKLSFLIDLDKKNPDAISKLVKDSGINPLDMEVDKSDYKPNTYTVDDREIELDSVLESIQDTPTFNQTIAVVSNKWDGPSKQIVAENPQLLSVINGHIASGVYDLINTEVERQRVFGRLNGVSDIEAYRQVGDALQAKGAFSQLEKPAVKSEPVREPITLPTKAEDPIARAKKLAASSPKAAAVPAKVDPEFNPLALSDDDFAKIGTPHLL